MKKNYLFFIFLVVALIQLIVPYNMISRKEEVVSEGELLRFKTAPIDPTDPFRGKYIVLSFIMDTYKTSQKWDVNETVYVTFKTDAEKFGVIDSLFKEKPLNTTTYLTTTIRRVNSVNKEYKTVRIKIPFDRYYMEESKAKPAEDLYRENNRRHLKRENDTYAEVYLKNGDYVLDAVKIDGVRIEDLVQKNSEI